MTTQPPPIPWQLASIRYSFRLLDRLAPRLAATAALELFTQPLSRRRAQNALLERAERLKIAYAESYVHAYAWGHGPTVLLVHGWETDAEMMTAFVEPLCAAGFRVVAMDGPAHGRSPGRRADLPIFSAAIAAVAQAQGPLAGIVAHSFGVASTLWMFGQPNPPQVERLVLISGPADVSSMMDYFIGMISLPPRSTRMLHQVFQRRYGMPASAVSITNVAAQARDLPSLIIHDRHDKRVPFSHGEQIAAALPHGRLLATDGLGHNRILRDPTIAQQVAYFFAAPSNNSARA